MYFVDKRRFLPFDEEQYLSELLSGNIKHIDGRLKLPASYIHYCSSTYVYRECGMIIYGTRASANQMANDETLDWSYELDCYDQVRQTIGYKIITRVP